MGQPHAVLLVKGHKVLVDEEDYANASQYDWHIDSTNGHVGRAPRKSEKPWEKLEDRRRVYLHREVVGNPEGLHVIHINRNLLDCRKANLRVCDDQLRRYADRPQKRGKSAYKGVSPDGDKWRVRLSTPLGRKSIGRFEDEVEAAQAYDKAARTYQGEHAYTNFPQGGD